MDFYFRQYWNDPRLGYNDRSGIDTLEVSSDFTEKIWVPDTFFPNEKRSYYHSATTANEMLRISPQGKVLRSIR